MIYQRLGMTLGLFWLMSLTMSSRPSKESMKRWADLVDDPSYLFENTLPYFKKTVSFTPPTGYRFGNATARYNEFAFDATGRPLQVSYPKYAMPFSTWVKQGFQEIGIHEAQDFNSGSLMGHQFSAMTIQPTDEARSSSESAFLRGSLGFETLSIYQTTLAKQILFDDQKRAIGVVAQQNNIFNLMAKREVIISAGAFQSPQLLMVSGIGAAEILRQYGINVVANLRGVGQNMWDHVFFGPSYRVAVDTFTLLSTSAWYYAYQLAAWTTISNGVLTNPSTDYIAFEKLPPDYRSGLSSQNQQDLTWFPDDWPEVEVSGMIIIT